MQYIIGSDVPTSPRDVTTGATNPGALSLWSTDVVYVRSVALDWLTITTPDRAAFRWAVGLIEAHTPASERREAQVMQYRGWKGDGYQVGVGEQQGDQHFMVRLWGSVAQSFMQAAICYPRMLELFRCTRADVQYTYDEVPSVRLGAVGEALRAADWSSHKGRKPEINYYSNNDGLDTLYIGSRSSVRMQRVYVKPIDKVAHLRWEVEYKEQLAGNLWAALLAGGLAVLPGILAGEMVVVPLAVCPELAGLPALVGAPADRLKLRRDDGDAMTAIAWVWNSVLPCVRRLQSGNPKIRHLVREFLLAAWAAPEAAPAYPGIDMAGFLDEWLVEV
jgi:hypothetical protein